MRITYLDMMIDSVVGPRAVGGPTRLACEETRMMARTTSHKIQFVTCGGSASINYFDGLDFRVLRAPPKVQVPRRALAVRNREMAAECAKFIKSDVVLSHAEPGLTSHLSRLRPDLPIVFIHHLWPSTNKFFDLGRFRQLLHMDELGVHVVFNSKPNLKRHIELARRYAEKSTDDKEIELCRRFQKWCLHHRDSVVNILYFAPEIEFNPEMRNFHVVASRCMADKRIHSWARVKRNVMGLFTPYNGTEYEIETKALLEANPHWRIHFAAPYSSVQKAFSFAISNLATGPTDSFGLTVFEAGSFGTPSVLGRAGGHSAVVDLLDDIDVKFPIVEYGSSNMVDHMHAAMDACKKQWNEKKRKRLYDHFQKTFARKRLVKDRERLLETAIGLRQHVASPKSRGSLF